MKSVARTNVEEPEHLPFKLGELLDGRFELLDVLGFGGYGLVYKAVQVTTGQLVAVKVLRRDKVQLQSQLELDRFKREMQIIARICHTNIVRLIDFDELPDGTFYMVIEYIKGDPLSEVLKEEGGLRPREAFHFMRQIIDGLNAVHQQGVVYRDLKPANIMITRTGGTRNAVLLDFGVSGISNDDSGLENLTTDGSVRGTPSYMAPEQLRQLAVTSQTDIYAWGLVFLEALMGRKVITRASQVEVMAAQISTDPVPVPEEIASSTCGSIIQRAVEKDLSVRWSSAEEILSMMEHCYIDPKLSLPWTGAVGLEKIRKTADMLSSEHSRPTSSQTVQSLEISEEMLEPIESDAPPSKSGGGKKLVWGVGALVICAVLIAVGVMSTQTATVDAPVTSGAEKSAAVRVQVQAEPRSALILVDKRQIGSGSVDVEFTDGAEHVLRVEADGYQPEEYLFRERSPVSQVNLRRVSEVAGENIEVQVVPETEIPVVDSRPPEPTKRASDVRVTPKNRGGDSKPVPVAEVVEPVEPVEPAEAVEVVTKPVSKPKPITFEPVGASEKAVFAPVGASDTPDPWSKPAKDAVPDPWKE